MKKFFADQEIKVLSTWCGLDRTSFLEERALDTDERADTVAFAPDGVVLQDQIELGPSLSDRAFATTLFPLWL